MKNIALIALVLTGFISIPAYAVRNAQAEGTVKQLQAMGDVEGYSTEVFTFTLTPAPAPVPGAVFQYFSISPQTVPDEQSRKNMISLLMMAKASGAQIAVAYDKDGGFLDNRMIGVYYITVR